MNDIHVPTEGKSESGFLWKKALKAIVRISITKCKKIKRCQRKRSHSLVINWQRRILNDILYIQQVTRVSQPTQCWSSTNLAENKKFPQRSFKKLSSNCITIDIIAKMNKNWFQDDSKEMYCTRRTNRLKANSTEWYTPEKNNGFLYRAIVDYVLRSHVKTVGSL
jgi:hypothetical protein